MSVWGLLDPLDLEAQRAVSCQESSWGAESLSSLSSCLLDLNFTICQMDFGDSDTR